MRLHTIKSQILSILRLEQAPNISRDMIKQLLPKAPPLQELLSQYDLQVEDRKVWATDDGEHATTETIITMATERRFYALHIYSSFTFIRLTFLLSSASNGQLRMKTIQNKK